MLKNTIDWVEAGCVPDSLVRRGIRKLNSDHLQREYAKPLEARQQEKEAFVKTLRQREIAVATDAANEQHYEIPSSFFTYALGKHLKYSGCYWPEHVHSLDEAEEAMLRLYTERARLEDGQHMLDLGCGWGSLCLFLAQEYPNSYITAVSNSSGQREFIMKTAIERGLNNLEVHTADINHFAPEKTFDRVLSVEMFEHVQNHPQLFSRIASWLNPGGLLFFHVFCHRDLLYSFDTGEETNWIGKYFFTGGIMPSADLFLRYQDDLRFIQQWKVGGLHYEKTANAWLHRYDQNKEPIQAILRETYGEDEAKRWWNRWRVFFMACAELFGHDQGEAWFVSHYLFEKRGDAL
mgnify:CR=1 FL=1